MDPAVPERPVAGRAIRPPAGPVDFTKPSASADPNVEVGAFRQGTQTSRWALSRYLVGRAIIEAVGISMLLIALAFLALAAACEWWLHETAAAILALMFGLVVLLVRAATLGVLRRLTAVRRSAPTDQRLAALVKETRGDVLRELRRLGLPGRSITLPWLAVRLIGRRRADTLSRLRRFDIDRVVPPARLDELHLLWNDASGTPPR